MRDGRRFRLVAWSFTALAGPGCTLGSIGAMGTDGLAVGFTDARSDSAEVDAGADGAIASTSGTFVAVGYGGRRIRSTDDALTWTDDVSLEVNGRDDQDLLRTVVGGDRGWLALGWRAMTSSDGSASSWTDQGLLPINNWMGAVVYAQGKYVALGGYGVRATSPDGIHWTNHGIDTVATHAGDALVYGAGRFVSANDNGRRSYSTDGATWVYANGASATPTSEVAYGGGVFVGIGDTHVVRSADGMSWDDAGQLGGSVLGLIFAQGHFTAIADGRVYTSVDGQGWTDHTVPNARRGAIAFGHGTYVLLAGQMMRSTDGLSWQTVAIPGSGNGLNWVAFAPDP
jgi:hypothetical protein